MKSYTVFAERTVLESITVKARSEQEAIDTAFMADGDEWSTENDIDWEITGATLEN